MRRVVLAALVAASLVPAVALADSVTRENWVRSDHTMGEALDNGFVVVDTFYTPKGALIFVLQRQSELLLCTYQEQQVQECTELGRD